MAAKTKLSANAFVEKAVEKDPEISTEELIAGLKKARIKASPTAVAWRKSICVRFGSIAKYTSGKRAQLKDPKKKETAKSARTRRVATVTVHAH